VLAVSIASHQGRAVGVVGMPMCVEAKRVGIHHKEMATSGDRASTVAGCCVRDKK